MNRRHWLQLASASLVPTVLCAREGRGRWNDETIQDYSGRLIEWLKKNFDARSKELARHTGQPFVLKYEYNLETEDRRKLRLLEKFAKLNLSRRVMAEHVSACLSDFERVRKDLAVAEKVAAQAWEGEKREARLIGGDVFDMNVTAGYLGVVLDNSPSMRPFLKDLRKEISRDFKDAYFVETNGCDLRSAPLSPWFYAAPTNAINPFSEDRHIPQVPTFEESAYSQYVRWIRDAPGALHCMHSLMRMDAVYWFCDFDDPSRDDVIRAMARDFIASKTRLYVHTLGKRPPALIAELAERSGGKVLRKRI